MPSSICLHCSEEIPYKTNPATTCPKCGRSPATGRSLPKRRPANEAELAKLIAVETAAELKRRAVGIGIPFGVGIWISFVIMGLAVGGFVFCVLPVLGLSLL